jgi:hypothetical protein
VKNTEKTSEHQSPEKVRKESAKLSAVDLKGKSLKGENDFLMEQKITSSLNHLPFVRF